MKIGVFITAYNVEQKIISEVLSKISSEDLAQIEEVLVVDNQSTDRTAQKALEYRNDFPMPHKLKVLLNTQNYGYGGSHKVAFHYFIERGFDYAILLHGDGQGDPKYLTEFLRRIQSGNPDIVIGSRFLDLTKNREYSRLRTIANLFFVKLQRIVSGMKVSDPGSGYIAYNLKFLSKLPYWTLPSYYYYDPCLFLLSAPLKPSIEEFPIHWGKVEHSNVNVFSYGLKLLWVLIRFRFRGVPTEEATISQYTYAVAPT